MRYVLLAIAVFATQSVMADQVTISTGIKGGSYDSVYGRNLQEYLKSKGIDSKVLNSQGSEENLLRLKSGEAQITFATVDAYAAYLKKGNPPLKILANLKTECVYLVGAKKGKVTDEDNLQTVKDVKIAIGKAGSGSAVAWSYMCQLEPKYGNAAVTYDGGTLALNQIGTPGGPDAMLFVTTKDNLTHKLVQAVNANKNLMFVDVNDGDLNDKLPDGTQVYKFLTNEVCSGWGCSVKTICTDGALFYSESTPSDVIEEISDIMAMSPKTITGE